MKFEQALISRLAKHKPLDRVGASVATSPAFALAAKWSHKKKVFKERIDSYPPLSSNVFAQIAGSANRAIIPSRLVVPRDFFIKMVCAENEFADSKFQQVLVPDLRPVAKTTDHVVYLPNDIKFYSDFLLSEKNKDFQFTPPFMVALEKGFTPIGFLAQNLKVISQITLEKLQLQLDQLPKDLAVRNNASFVTLSFSRAPEIVTFSPLTFHINIPDSQMEKALQKLPKKIPINPQTVPFLKTLYKTLIYYERSDYLLS
ncbi:hypothetical protein OGAPHI_003115 [Ogataea philodendri]|uniref:Required for respiratory growth protein 8, mitochondrial n=1 Tax=Ogataea philodendri TaxID=1378263 RepID=A0A9P8P988_9ASCO|nr:uncharacterized protein OGAPHI_003115 [Ogataea philodendri]KAH3667466.1 hypothetical protein OGAPHI_003115 [Ogataea philodendri]